MNFEKIWAIAFYTCKEILRSKILLSVVFIGLSLVVVTYTATEFTYGTPSRVALDFGLGMLSLSSLGISLFLGVTLLSKEIDSRTVYMVISRPVPRFVFILGKILGLLIVQALNVLILGSFIILTLLVLDANIDPLFWWAIFFTYLESVLLLLVVVLFSLISNTVLSTLMSAALLILGHAAKDAQGISFVLSRPVLKTLLEVYHFVLPGFYKLNLKDYMIYQTQINATYLLNTLLYVTFYSLFLLGLTIVIFNRKNLD